MPASYCVIYYTQVPVPQTMSFRWSDISDGELYLVFLSSIVILSFRCKDSYYSLNFQILEGLFRFIHVGSKDVGLPHTVPVPL